MDSYVIVREVSEYDEDKIYKNLPDELFHAIQPGNTVVLKPNWVLESHKFRKEDWDYVITHPTIITAVLHKVINCLQGSGHIIITDGPTTEASFSKLISRYPLDKWHKLAEQTGISLNVTDLRDFEWVTQRDVIVKRINLPGDPKGKVLYNLNNDASAFYGHKMSSRGYYGADYNMGETNEAHDGFTNLYSVSRTVIESDVFINLPKLKTHRKAGITCCLKNLVGINTYKNYLPHHSEGGPSCGGDQFPMDGLKSKMESSLTAVVKKYIFSNLLLANYLNRITDIGKTLFGKTGEVVRSGNWFGNDTIWRMITDLNKVLFYGNPDGSMRSDTFGNCKKYIGIVDAILAGDGFGPLQPNPVKMNYIFCGTNPVAIDAVCATFMGFDYLRIPAIANAFGVKKYSFCPFKARDINILINEKRIPFANTPEEYLFNFEAAFGWKGHIEKIRSVT